MRVLISGVLGAVLATTVWLGIEHYSQSNLGWLVCLVGIATGVAIRWGGSTSAIPGVRRGALAIALTLFAIVAGRVGYAKLMQVNMAQASGTAVAPAVAITVAKNNSTAEKDHNDSTTASQKVEVFDRPAPLALQNAKRSIAVKRSFSQWDMFWMSLAALAAYIISSNGSSSNASAAKEEQISEELENVE